MLNRPREYVGKTKALTADERAYLSKELSDQVFLTKHLYELIQATKLIDLDMVHSMLSLSEHRHANLGRTLEIELDSTQTREARFADIRQANERIRQLERELGKQGSCARSQQHLAALSEKLNNWWDAYGFGHIAELNFTAQGSAKVEFSCHLFGINQNSFSQTPVSDRSNHAAWLDSLRARGFELLREDESGSSHDQALLDNDNNQEILAQLFRAHFPSSRVFQTTNHINPRGRKLVSISVLFHRLDEIEALAPAEK